MNSQIVGLRVASAIFGLMALRHLFRLADPIQSSCRGTPDATLAKRACHSPFWRAKSVAVEALPHRAG